MCFSPEVDATAGLLVTAVGIDALRHVSRPRQVALACLPIMFGVHQLIETFVWWHLQGRVGDTCGDLAAYSYLFIALIIVPVAVPVAFLLLGVGRSRVMDWLFVAAGLVAATILGSLLGLDPGRRMIEGRQISYLVGVPIPDVTLTIYVIATCGPALLARSRILQLFGVLNLVVVIGLAALNQSGVISLWCVWAAVTSVLINLYLRRAIRGPQKRPVDDAVQTDRLTP